MTLFQRTVPSLLRSVPLLFALLSCGPGDDAAPPGSGAAAAGDAEPPLFTLLASSRTGVTFANRLEEDATMNGLLYEYFYNGGGVAVGDVDGDGLPDLYFTGNRVPNRLYLNRGDLRFEDVTEAAGVAGHAGWATGVTLADVDGDGRLDIHVSYAGAPKDPDLRRNQLFLNRGVRNGVPTFTDEAPALGLDDPGASTQAAFFDYDGDGDLDAYVLNHGRPGESFGEAESDPSPVLYLDRLYRNDDGRFVDATEAAGLVDTPDGFGLGLAVGDVDRDGRPDVYVANDYSGRDYLYLGRSGGRFEEVGREAFGHMPYASMGADLADFDGDGWLDLAVLDMAMPGHYDRMMSESGAEGLRFRELVATGGHYQYTTNVLQWNRGPGGDGTPVFSDVATLVGVARTDWSWAPLFADLDGDGRPDLFVTNGTAGDMVERDFKMYRFMRIQRAMATEGRLTHSLVQDVLRALPRRRVHDMAYRNEGDLSFRDRSAAWGFGRPTFSNGAAVADLDRDGDLDLVVNVLMGEASIYRNESRERRPGEAHFLRIRFRGPAGNPFGVGTRARLVAARRSQVQELQPTRGYESSTEPVLHFGLGAATRVDTLEVVWPDGAREVRTDLAADTEVVLARAGVRSSSGTPGRPPAIEGRLFEDASGALRPPTVVPRTLPAGHPALQPYPSLRDEVALATGDLDGDGRDDLVLGGGPGEPLRLYLARPDGRFRGGPMGAGDGATRGRTAVAAAVFDADGDGSRDVWLVQADTGLAGARTHHHRLLRGDGSGGFREVRGALPALPGAGSVLRAADVDGDGDPDLFVGGRGVPGWGALPGSHLLLNDGGTFRDGTDEVGPALARLGTVTDAAWGDVDGNGTPDLVVVGEWMPVTVFLNDGGRLHDATDGAGLSGTAGWWESVTVADLDGDGDRDVVAGNVGLEHPARPTGDAPFELYVSDFDRNGIVEAVPAYRPDGTLRPWLDRNRMGRALPWIVFRYESNERYARASLGEILGPGLRDARRLEARTFATTAFLNDGAGAFETRTLPRAAQVSATTGVVPGDFDGDGVLDLVLGGNLDALGSSVPREDGGVGLFLKGDGSGGFRSVMPQESGLLLRGAVRHLAALRTAPGAPPSVVAAVAGGSPILLRAVGGSVSRR